MRRNGIFFVRRGGFTLIEILLSVAILAVLGTVSFAVYSSVQKQVRVQKTDMLLYLLEGSLESYGLDHGGEYPAGQADLPAAQSLFRELSGYDERGTGAKVCYAPYLELEGEYVYELSVVDSFQNYIRYCPVDEQKEVTEIEGRYNPNFALWSIGEELQRDVDANPNNNQTTKR